MNDSLLSFVARQHTSDLEDVATNSLFFILSRSNSARSALSDFLKDENRPLPIAKTETWAAVAHGAEPDLACFDGEGNKVAFIEAKFWAPLTHHQPVTYWEELPGDRPTVLLFLAPDYRIDQGSLWDELEDQLHKAGHELGPAVRCKGQVVASAKADQRRLMLSSWHTLLDRIEERAKEEGEVRTRFQIAELRGLANSAIKGDNPGRDEKLRELVNEAVERLRRLGWANTDKLTTGESRGVYFARYLRLAGVSVGLRIDYEANRKMPGKLLWLWCYGESDDVVTKEQVRTVLGGKAEPLEWLGEDVCVPITFGDGDNRDAIRDAIVDQLESIAALIDPKGPTYRRGAPIAGGSRPVTRPEPKRSIERRVRGCAPIRVVCWNIATMHEPWRVLADMDADVALLQEAGRPPDDVAARVDIGPEAHWDSHAWNSRWWEGRFDNLYDRWPMVVKLSDRVEVEWFKQVSPIGETNGDEIAVSGIGTVAAARVKPEGGLPFIAVSMYARWIAPHSSTSTSWSVGYSDGSAHRIISDLSAFIGSTNPRMHRILAAGDLNMSFWSADPFDNRAQTVVDRFHALGLEYMGPQHPAGRQADPIPAHLNEESLDVPTYYSKSSNTPAGAYVQIDHVFASRGFDEEVQTRALNEVSEWGPSDHCRIAIDVG